MLSCERVLLAGWREGVEGTTGSLYNRFGQDRRKTVSAFARIEIGAIGHFI